MKLGLLFGLTLSPVTSALDASASPLLDLTGGLDGRGGLQAGTISGGPSAAYFNPALLVRAPFGFTVGFFMIGEQMGISLDGRPGTQYAVPNGVERATHADDSPIGNVPIPTNVLQNGRPASGTQPALVAHPRQGAGTGHQVFAYEMFGFVAKMAEDRLAFGVYGIVPDGNFTNLNAFYPDEREQFFSNSLHPELYDDRLTPVSIAFGVGWRVTDFLSVGLGGSLSLQAGVAAPVYVSNAGALQNLLIDTNASVNVSLSPNLGVAYDPTPRWHFTGTVHTPEKVELGVGFSFLLPDTPKQSSDFTLVYDYMPWQLGAGAAYDLLQNQDETLTFAATGVYGKWSDYLDRHGESPIPAYGWYDTLTPTAGVRYRRGAIGTFLDAQYKPTPVPLQTGRTNYVDNDRVGAGAGVDYAFSFLRTPMRFGVQLQAYWLAPRHQNKLSTPAEPDGRNHYPALVADEVPDDSTVNGQNGPQLLAGSQGLQTNNPGWPGFGSQGGIVEGGLYLVVMP